MFVEAIDNVFFVKIQFLFLQCEMCEIKRIHNHIINGGKTLEYKL